MKDYTKHLDNYPIPKEEFIKRYVLEKGKYVVKLADGTIISVPKTEKQKEVLDKIISNQITNISEENINSLQKKLDDSLLFNRFILSSQLLLSAFNVFFGSFDFSLGTRTLLTYNLILVLTTFSISYVPYLKKKKLYNEIIKNKTIVESADEINSLLQIRKLTIGKDLIPTFKLSNKKVVKKFIETNEKASVNYLENISLRKLLLLKKAALNYKKQISDFKEEETKKVPVKVKNYYNKNN